MFTNLYSLFGKSAVQPTKPVFSRWVRLTTIYGGRTNRGFNPSNFYSWAVSFLGFVFNSCTMHASQDCVSMRTLILISSSVIVDRGVIGWGSLCFYVSVSYYIEYKYQIKKSDQTNLNRFSFINADLLNENKRSVFGLLNILQLFDVRVSLFATHLIKFTVQYFTVSVISYRKCNGRNNE